MENTEFNKVENNLKIVSKIIYIIAIILRIITIIGIVACVIALVIVPMLFNLIKIDGDKISFIEDKFTINFSIPDAEISLENEDGNINSISVPFNSIISSGIDKIMSKGIQFYSIMFVILDLTFIANSIMVVLALKKVDKIFKNIANSNEIFTKDNSNSLKLIAIFTCVTFGIIVLQRTIFGIMFEIKNSLGFDLKYILYVLVVFGFYYIFEYERLLKDSVGKEAIENK